MSGWVRALRVPSTRKRLLVTLGAVLMFRLGQNLPLPGVDGPVGPGGLLDLVTGGGLRAPAVLALGVVPLYAARVLTSVLTVLVPRMRALKAYEDREGGSAVGRFTRYLTVGLGALGGVAVVVAADAGRLFPDGVAAVACMTAGTALTLRLAEWIGDRGLGAGMSLLFLTQVAAVLPGQAYAAGGVPALAVVPAVALVVVLAVVTARQAKRNVPVQRAKRMMGRWPHPTDTVHIPIRFDQAGYNPMVWASLAVFVPAWVWDLGGPWYLAAAFVAVVLGMYLCALRVLDPEKVAGDLRRQGGFVPGIEPGRPTAAYLGHVRARMAWWNGLYSGVIVLLPMVALAVLGIGARDPLNAPGILVAAGLSMIVSRDVAQQVESSFLEERYAAFLR
ncbi:preprotein translocase subunit SecY [Streptomyces sp. NPDC088762]|uniref:preprotein translocase subunit SecY n=1 Tax=Streptomyces sp. NPDC088762 TaxID=3365891 RepID=UPI00381EB3E7